MKKITFVIIIIGLIKTGFAFEPVFKDTLKVYPFDPVVITGTRTEMPKKDLPVSLSIVSSKVIEEQGSVISGDGDFVVVSVERQSACGSCSAKAGCGTSLLADWFPRRRLTLRLPNTVGAKPGEAVVLGLDEARFQTASLLLYALPLAGLLLGAIAGESLVGVVGGPPELGGVGGGNAGGGAGSASPS